MLFKGTKNQCSIPLISTTRICIGMYEYALQLLEDDRKLWKMTTKAVRLHLFPETVGLCNVTQFLPPNITSFM